MRVVIALLVAVATASLVAFALALWAGHLLASHTKIGLTAGVGAGVLAFMQTERLPSQRVSRWEIFLWVVFGLFAVRSFCWLLYFDRDMLKVGAPNNLGDLSRHILYAKMFASGQPIWPDNPIHAWATLRYYPGADFFQAMLQQLGLDERRTLTWCGLAGSALTAMALRRWGGPFTMAGFLFAGGLAGFAFLWTGVVKDYQMTLAWKPLPTAIFLTQRGFLFALPAGLILLAHWRGKFFSKAVSPAVEAAPVANDPPPAPRAWLRPENPAPIVAPLPPARALAPFLPLWVEVTLLIGLAWFQLYAFLFLISLLAFWFVAYFPLREIRRHVGTLLALSLPPVAALTALMTDFGAANSIHWHPGWMRKPPWDFFGFWAINFGLSLPVAAWLWARLTLRRTRALLDGHQLADAAEAFVIPAGLAFFACTVVAFAPWDWDNTKLMIWSYLIILPFVWELLLAPSPAAVRWIGCALLFFSGAVSLAGGLRANEKGYELARRSHLDGLAVTLRDIPLSARFASAPEFNHPLILSGRRIAMGYDGHLYGYGLSYDRLRREVENLMLGRRGWEKSAARLGVTHIYWGPNERQRYPKSTRAWEVDGRVVGSGEWGKIIELSPPAPRN
jgi:hypothetical protein